MDYQGHTFPFTIKGTLAGRVASDHARAGREYSVAVPADAAAAGDKAELAWLLAFNETFFKPDTAAPPFADRVVGGLVTPAHRRRRTSSKPEVNKAGRAGLDESAAEMHVSSAVYTWVRSDFFLPDDHGRALVRAGLTAEGFNFSDTDEASWWEEKGHALALAKAKAARYSLVEAVKQSIWLAHGAYASQHNVTASACLLICCWQSDIAARRHNNLRPQWARPRPQRRRSLQRVARSARHTTCRSQRATLLQSCCSPGMAR